MPLRRPSAAGLLPILLLPLPGCSPNTPEPARVPPTAATSDRPQPPPAPVAKAKEEAKAKAKAKESTTTPDTPDALVAQAEKAAKDGDLAEAIRRLERALMSAPDHRRALFLLAVLTQERASGMDRPASSPLYLKSAEAIRKLRDTVKGLTAPERDVLATCLYNEACTYAIQDQGDKALAALAEAVAAGFAQPDLLAEDEELDSVRALPRFAELTAKVEENARSQALENARKLLAAAPLFPFDFALPDLEGNTVTLDDVKGKVTVVDFWGTWCPPCRKEVPHFRALLAKYHDQGLAIVGINYERVADPDVKATVKAFVKEHNVPFPCLIGDDTTREQVPDFAGYPTTLFLDRSGKVRAKLAGYHPSMDPVHEAIIAQLLREGSDR